MEIIGGFCEKFSIPEEGRDELMKIFKDSFVHIAMGIMNMPGVEVAKTTTKKKSTTSKKRCAGTTKAGNNCKKYAQEGSEYCKTHDTKGSESDSDDISRGGRVCNGTMRNGEPCNNKRGELTQPEGSSNYYCFRHKKSWKKYEGDITETEGAEGAVASEKVELTPEQKREMEVNGFTDVDEYLKSVGMFEQIRENETKNMSDDDKKKYDEASYVSDSSSSSDSDSDKKGDDDAKEATVVDTKKYRRPRVRGKKQEQ